MELCRDRACATPVVSGASRTSGNYGQVFVLRVAPTGLISPRASVLRGPAERSFYGHEVASAGDLNGDGFDDLAVGAFGADERGAVYLYEGSATGVTPTPTVTTPSYGGVDTDYGIALGSRL